MTENQPELRDYVAWHDAYQDRTSALSTRLRHVQQAITEHYERTTGPVRVMSSCAGQGDDIFGVLRDHPEWRERTTGTLIELLEPNAAVARERIDSLGVDLQVHVGDASTTDAYADAVPADLVLLVGIMGNISADDIHRLVATAPQFCSPGATVIWTRGDQQPDLGPQIRDWFREAGFTELAYRDRLEGTSMRVGVEQLAREPEPLRPGVRLFTFFR